jgi:hypothetical protein
MTSNSCQDSAPFGVDGAPIDLSAGDFVVPDSVTAIVLTSAGDVVCRAASGTEDITLTGLPAGYILPWRCSVIRQAGTTATLATILASEAPLSGFDVIVLAGQSNMIGRYGPIDPVLDATNDRIQQYGATSMSVMLAADPLDHPGQDNPNTVGMGLSSAKAYIAAGRLASGRQVLLVPVARGATSFSDGTWRAGGAGDTTAIANVNAAMATHPDNRLVAICWHQGEGDSTLTEAQYQTELDALITRWRSSMTGAGPTTPFVVGGLLVGGNFTSPGVSAALQSLPARRGYTGYASSEGLESGGDNLHFSAASERTFGGRYFDAIVAAEQNVPPVDTSTVAPASEWTTFGNATKNTAASTAAFRGSSGSVRGGVVIPLLNLVAGKQYTVSASFTAESRALFGTAPQTSDLLNGAIVPTSGGARSWTFTAAGPTAYVTFDKSSTTNNTVVSQVEIAAV